MPRVVLDTNIIFAGLKSRSGASNALLQAIGTGQFEFVLSVPLVFEYEEVLIREIEKLPYTEDEVGEIIDYLCANCHAQEIYYLWRPVLRDPDDDMLLEVAVAGECEAIVTLNTRHFGEAREFGIKVYTPGEFIRRLKGVE